MKKSTLPTHATFLGILVLLEALLQASAWAAPLQKNLRFGLVLGLTGAAAHHSTGIQHGVDLAVKDLRAQGWQVTVFPQDDQSNPAKSVSAYQLLISQGIRFIIGPTWSFQVKAVRPLVEQGKIVCLVPGGSSEISGGALSGIFGFYPSRFTQLPALSTWLAQRSFKKVLVFTPEGDWGDVHRQIFMQALSGGAAEISRDERYDYGIEMDSLRTILARAKADGVDLILTTSSGQDMANMLKARSDLHFGATVLTTDTLWDAISQNLVAPDLLRNTFVLGIRMPESFDKRYRETFKAPAPLYSERAYDAVMVLAEAVTKTDASPEKVRDYLLHHLDYHGVSGQVRFDQNGDGQSGKYEVVPGNIAWTKSEASPD